MTLEKKYYVPEYLKVQQHIIKLIARSGNQAMKIDSARKLGKMLGVTHPTVQRALKGLVRDGYLTATGNRGFVTVPSPMLAVNHFKVIGLIFRDGRQIYQDNASNLLHYSITRAILHRDPGYRIETLLNCGGESDELYDQIVKSGVDGVIWVKPLDSHLETALRLRRGGLPVIAFGAQGSHPYCAHWAFREEYAEIFDFLQKEGRSNIAVVGNPYGEMFSELHSGIESVRKSSVKVRYLMENELLNYSALKEILDSADRPDAVIFCGEIHPFMTLIRQMGETLPVAGEMTLFANMDFHGLVVRRKMTEAAEFMAERLERELQGKGNEPDYHTAIGISLHYT